MLTNLIDNAIKYSPEGGQIEVRLTADAEGRRAEIMVRDHGMGVPPEHRDAHWAGFRRAMAAGVAEAEGVPGPFPVRRASGSVEAAPGRLTLLRAPEGRVVGAVVVFG